MTKVISFQQAISNAQVYKKRHLLLGNGFSIACIPSIFTYQSLYKEADFGKFPEIKKAFNKLKTTDFEVVIKSLEQSASLLEVYAPEKKKVIKKMREDAETTKEILVQTIANNHPSVPNDIPERKFVACRNFLSNFYAGDGKVYTLNYDLLLYWTLMHDIEDKKLTLNPCDGFGRDTFFSSGEIEVSDYVTWQGTSNARSQNTYYLHGALHLFDIGADLQKYTWVDTGLPLVEQTRIALESDRFPLFVSEGDSSKKMKNITHSAYLYHNYKSFYSICSTMSYGKAPNTCLFTYGISFADNDEHILQNIAYGTIKHLFVGLYGEPDSERNQEIIKTVKKLKNLRTNKFPLVVSFYDAESANVWGK